MPFNAPWGGGGPCTPGRASTLLSILTPATHPWVPSPPRARASPRAAPLYSSALPSLSGVSGLPDGDRERVGLAGLGTAVPSQGSVNLRARGPSPQLLPGAGFHDLSQLPPKCAPSCRCCCSEDTSRTGPTAPVCGAMGQRAIPGNPAIMPTPWPAPAACRGARAPLPSRLPPGGPAGGRAGPAPQE